MDHALPGKPLKHAIGDEFVVFRRAQALGDGFEREQKSAEIGVLINGLRLLQLEGMCRRGGGSAQPGSPA